MAEFIGELKALDQAVAQLRVALVLLVANPAFGQALAGILEAEQFEVGLKHGRIIRLCQSIAEAERICSRSANFWILPVDVFGSGPNTTCLGTLKRAR